MEKAEWCSYIPENAKQPNSVCLYIHWNLAVYCSYWLWIIIIYTFSRFKLSSVHYCSSIETDWGRKHARSIPAAVLLACGDASLIHTCSSSWKNPLCWGVGANVWKSQPEPIPSWWVEERCSGVLWWFRFVTLPSCGCSGSILKHQEDMFAAELHRLKQQPLFSLVDFENLVDGIRSTVAEVCPVTQLVFNTKHVSNISGSYLKRWMKFIRILSH